VLFDELHCGERRHPESLICAGLSAIALVKESPPRSVVIGIDERVERLQPGAKGTVHLCLQAGVNICLGIVPSLSAGTVQAQLPPLRLVI